MNRRSRKDTPIHLSPQETDILSNLSLALEYKLPTSILTTPTSAQLTKLYTSLAKLLITCTEARTEFRINLLNSYSETPSFYKESIENFYLLTTFGSFMIEVINIKDFSFEDIFNILPKRIKKISLSIINYLYFREEILKPIYQIQESIKSQKGEINKYTKKADSIKTKCGKKEKEKEQMYQQLIDTEKKNAEAKRSLNSTKNDLHTLQERQKELSEQLNKAKTENETLRNEINEIKQNKKEIDFVLSQDPISIKRTLNQKVHDLDSIEANKKEMLDELTEINTYLKELEIIRKLTEKRTLMVDSYLSCLLTTKLSAKSVEKLEETILHEKGEIEKLEKDIVKAKNELKELSDYRSKYQEERDEQLSKENTMRNKYEKELNEAESKRIGLKAKITELKQTCEEKESFIEGEKNRNKMHQISLEKIRNRVVEDVMEYHKYIEKSF